MNHLTASWTILANGTMRYLRFDRVPPNGRSRNNADGGLEVGVSVYDLDEDGQPKDPDPSLESDGAEWALDGMQNRVGEWKRGRLPAYVVTGEEAGIGWDGEPLLTNVKILGEWDPDNPPTYLAKPEQED